MYCSFGQATKSTLPVKKTYSYEEQNEEERQQFIKTMKEEKNEDLVYIDQSGMDNRDVYEYGWGRKGQRIYGQRPGKKRENQHDEWLSFREIGCTIYWDWYSRFTGKCNTLRHWSSLYPLPGQGFQVKAHVANLFEMTIVVICKY